MTESPDDPHGSHTAEEDHGQPTEPGLWEFILANAGRLAVQGLIDLWFIVCRAARWMFYCVILALVPLVLTWLWLPNQESIDKTLEHGELAILAAALAGAALDTALDEGFPRQIKGLIVAGGVLIIVLAFALFCGVVGKSPQLSSDQIIEASKLLLWSSLVVGSAAIIGDIGRAR